MAKKNKKSKVKKPVSVETTLKALKMMQVGKVITMTPCKVFNPECINCKFYLCEGMMEWYYEKVKSVAPKKTKRKPKPPKRKNLCK